MIRFKDVPKSDDKKPDGKPDAKAAGKSESKSESKSDSKPEPMVAAPPSGDLLGDPAQDAPAKKPRGKRPRSA